jgi:GT2 family glycosyltransferase
MSSERNRLSFPAPEGFRVAEIKVVPRQAAAPTRVVHPDPAFRVALAPENPVGRGWHQLEICFPAEGIVEVIAKISFVNGEDFWQRLPAIERNHFAVHVRCSGPLTNITLTVSGSGRLLNPARITFRRVNRASWLLALASRLHHVIKRDGFAVIGTITQAAFRLTRPGTVVIGRGSAATAQEAPYDTWIRVFDEVPDRDRSRHVERLQTLRHQPLFSVLAILQAADEITLSRVARTLAEQVYPRWELIVAVPADRTDVFARELSQILADHIFHVIAHQTDDAATFNTLTAKSSGEILITLPAGAMLRSNALLELAFTLNAYPQTQLIYSDQDQIEADGKRQNPLFKPAWSPDVFDVSDYLGDITALRRETVLAVGGWRSNLAEANTYDLKLRVIGRIEPDKIVHLAKVLVHTRAKDPSEIATPSQRRTVEKAIRDHCERRNLNTEIVWPESASQPRLLYRIAEPKPLVSLLIPTRDRADILETCIRSILTRTTYRPYEILIIDNDSREAATQRLFEKLRREPSIRLLSRPGPFNFSALNNSAAREASGSIVGLLNNDLEVQDGGWLGEMVALACCPEVGCVGCKLLYPDKRIQHAGVYLGPGGLAGHGHRFASREASGYMNRLRMVQNVSAVTAACLLIRKSVFDQVCGLDESELKIALNDVDLCLKVRAAGYRNLWTPFAELIHHESISRGRDYSPAKAQRLLHEVNTLRRRWGPAIFSDPYYSPHLSYDAENFSLRAR